MSACTFRTNMYSNKNEKRHISSSRFWSILDPFILDSNIFQLAFGFVPLHTALFIDIFRPLFHPLFKETGLLYGSIAKKCGNSCHTKDFSSHIPLRISLKTMHQNVLWINTIFKISLHIRNIFAKIIRKIFPLSSNWTTPLYCRYIPTACSATYRHGLSKFDALVFASSVIVYSGLTGLMPHSGYYCGASIGQNHCQNKDPGAALYLFLFISILQSSPI